MNEPIYEYVKGSGWIATTEVRVETTYRGRRVWLINRKPKAGELHLNINIRNRSWVFEDFVDLIQHKMPTPRCLPEYSNSHAYCVVEYLNE